MSAGSDSVAGVHTAGPWPIEPTGDGKRIIIGKGLVEGPNGYEVAEVYSDDCQREVAEANARLIAAAPELLEALEHIINGALSLPRFAEEQALAALAKARSPQ